MDFVGPFGCAGGRDAGARAGDVSRSASAMEMNCRYGSDGFAGDRGNQSSH